MLQSYNCLFPYEYKALSEDEYIIAASGRLRSHEAFVTDNIVSCKGGTMTLPCMIHDIDDSTCEFRDGLGSKIDTRITQINVGAGWENVDITGPFSNTDPVYQHKGKIVFIHFILEPVLFNKTITGSAKTDGKMFSKQFYSRLEFLYNTRFGATYFAEEETINSLDKSTGEMTTSAGSYILNFPDAVTLAVDDIIPADSFVDKAVDLDLEPPYIKVSIRKEYSYLRKAFTFDSNKIINIIE